MMKNPESKEKYEKCWHFAVVVKQWNILIFFYSHFDDEKLFAICNFAVCIILK